jgi:hypothetical protein
VGDLGDAPDRLRDAALALVRDERGVRVEDYLTSLAATTGESALATAGFDVEAHDLTPGAPLFYEPVNRVLTGDVLEEVPTETVYGILQGLVDDTPTPKELYEHVASHVGAAQWGQVALTVATDHRPWVLPLRTAFELRPTVVALEADRGLAVSDRAALSATALRAAIEQVSRAIDPSLAVRLALEVTFGMAKMTPMTQAALDGANSTPDQERG